MVRHMRFALAALLITASPALAEPTLVGFARLDAHTFRDGPTSGQFLDPAGANGVTPPFENKQPVQGISSVVASDTPGTYLALSDNGFGAKANSADYVLCVYKVTPHFAGPAGKAPPTESSFDPRGTVTWKLAFELSDPNKHVPWPIVAEGETYPDSDIPVPAVVREKRLLTGADFDVESMVRLPDGTFWLGDEFGPFLLHFDAEGRLLMAPKTPITTDDILQSPDRVERLGESEVNVQRSAGFEAMVPGPGALAYAILEKPLDGEDGLIRVKVDVNDLDPPLYGPARVPLVPGTTAMGGADVVGETRHLLAVLRDDEQGPAAKNKVLVFYKSLGDSIDELGTQFPMRIGGPSNPEVAADLLNLADPDDLDGDGSDRFRFPYVTIESVVVVDERTVMVVNDNNYPFSNGRPEREGPDETEFILIRFDRPLAEMGDRP